MPRPTDMGTRQSILVLSRTGMRQGAIAQSVGVTRATVNRILQRHQRTGNVAPDKSSGRPKVTTRRMDRFILLSVRRNRRVTVGTLQRRLRRDFGLNISLRTINNRLLSLGFRACRTVWFPKLTPQHRYNRRVWARRHQNLTVAHWGHVIFADESRFMLYRKDGRMRVRRMRGEALREADMGEAVAYGGGSVHVWGAICSHGKSPLVVLDRNVNAVVYRDILANSLLPYARGLFGDNFRYQDDNARPHRARLVEVYCAQQRVVGMEQPARSPDLNPIEHIWSDMSRELNNMDNPPQNLAELRAALVNIWRDIGVQRLVNLVDSMPRRLGAVMRAWGGPTRY